MTRDGLLLIDAGNTRVKWAVAETPGRPLPQLKGEIPTAEVTPDFVQMLDRNFPHHGVILSSVVPAINSTFSRIFEPGFQLITCETPALGLRFDYPTPAEIGADRLAAAVAVHADGPWPVIVVSAGTATAFTVLDGEGRLCGGAIAPGLQTQLSALLGATAQLPETLLQMPTSALGRSTEEAIRAGVVLGFQGGVNEILRQLIAALPGHHPRIVLTGGNASYLTGSLQVPYTVRPLLVFEGLRIIGARIWNSTIDP